jgi:hypothetical protein
VFAFRFDWPATTATSVLFGLRGARRLGVQIAWKRFPLGQIVRNFGMENSPFVLQKEGRPCVAAQERGMPHPRIIEMV